MDSRKISDCPTHDEFNYSTLFNDTYETKSFYFPFEMIKHGGTVDMAPRSLGGDGGLYFDE